LAESQLVAAAHTAAWHDLAARLCLQHHTLQSTKGFGGLTYTSIQARTFVQVPHVSVKQHGNSAKHHPLFQNGTEYSRLPQLSFDMIN
jgi:hypothetical protein